MQHRTPVARPSLPTLFLATCVGFGGVCAGVAAQSTDAAGSADSPDPAEPPSNQRPLEEAITVSPGETCLDEARLERRIARWLERDEVDVRISILVSGGSNATDVRFVVEREGEKSSERQLESVPEPCDQLHAAVALSIALSIDATLLGQGEMSDDEALGPEPEPEPEPEPGSNTIEALRPPRDQLVFTPDVSAGLGGGAAWNLVPDRAPVVRLFVGFSPYPWIDFRLGAVASQADDLRLEFADGSYGASLLGGRVDACFVTRVLEPVRAAACVGGLGALFSTEGDANFPGGGKAASSLWWAAVLGISLELPVLGPLALAVDVDADLALRTRRVQVDNTDGRILAFEELPPMAVLATLGLVVRFN